MSTSKDILEMTFREIAKMTEEVQADWNGDEHGIKETRAAIAHEIFTNLANINSLYKELENE